MKGSDFDLDAVEPVADAEANVATEKAFIAAMKRSKTMSLRECVAQFPRGDARRIAADIYRMAKG